MSNLVRALAVIPARGGSKRIPNKNIKALDDKPLIAYTLEAAQASAVFERIVVSTDSEIIAEIARTYGAEVPFVRSTELADDHSPVSLVTLDALSRLEAAGDSFTHVAQLMPNCPFRTAEDIKHSLEQFQRTNASAQLSVTRYGWLNPWWALEKQGGHALKPLFPEALTQRSQDLTELFCPTGAIWWATPAALSTARSFYTGTHTGFELPWQRALDIDDMDDWRMARALLALQALDSEASL